jgi:uncharacterized damage-inducible protein DinB
MSDESRELRNAFFLDLYRELTITRNVLERIPAAHFDWKPHEKSMSLGRLAAHVANLPDWARVTIVQNELNAADAPQPSEPRTSEELLAAFDRNAAALRDAVGRFDLAQLHATWSMRHGEQVLVTRPRDFVYRVWCLNHLIHHRAQLCLYLRLLDIPVPTVYFNTADNPAWVFA